MRIAFYNQMFGLNGRSFMSTLFGHWQVHFTYSKNGALRANLEDTVQTIKSSKSDIMGIAEILEGQETRLEMLLKDAGYLSVIYGNGHMTRYSKLRIKIAIASKYKAKQIELNGFPILNATGGGGGVVGCYIKDLDLCILSVHMASIKKEIYPEQMKFLLEATKNIKGKLILMGDFNRRYGDIKQYLAGMSLFSDCHNTCSVTPFFRLFYRKDIDHILGRGFKGVSSGTIEGFSDHKLVYVDLK